MLAIDVCQLTFYAVSCHVICMFVDVEHTKLGVPESCCKKDQYGEFINLKKCQRWTTGPPYKPGGHRNEALYYKVFVVYQCKK